MAAKLVNLRLIYGVAGAREKFEDLAFQLIKGEHQGAKKVRDKQGDDGLDVHVGDLTDPKGLQVFQCKFFPEGLGDAQKNQIRDSFNTCKESKNFKTRTWTLCLPVDLSIPEKKWFEQWKEKQKDSGIEITDPWCAAELEHLLAKKKNQGVRNEFFKEEHIAQIADLHADRDKEKRESRKREWKKYVRSLVETLRREYSKRLDGATLNQNPTSSSDTRRPASFECIIYPCNPSRNERFAHRKECRDAVTNCAIGPSFMPFPDLLRLDKRNGDDWAGGALRLSCGFEFWLLSQKGVFGTILAINDRSAERWILADDVVFRTTQAFRFAANLVKQIGLPSKVNICLRLADLADYRLIPRNGFFRREFTASTDDMKQRWKCTSNDLANPDSLAVQAATWIFESFGFEDSSSFVTSLQADFIRHL